MRHVKAIAFFGLLLLAPLSSEAGVARGRPLRTGQTTGYAAAGDTTSGLPRSYKDLGNGVIKDQKTALFWEKKDDSGGIHDKDTVYTWSSGLPWLGTGTAFTAFIVTLNTAPCFASYCDWRVPTLRELETISDLGTHNPAVPTIFDANCTPGCTVTTCSCTKSGFYWSSSTFELDPGYAWGLGFDFGASNTGDKRDGYAVRAVRGGA